ncbi:MAG: 16S rRNA (cytidine(1402)-2'-O)-methyltransferase [Bacillota bacterium]|nr:16S rRNA (cytidine(1402)-2'-O)-methyltransferase [Bacillota bacterium]
MGQGILYVCATPIGNLEDVSLRLLRVLGEVDVVAAEDTRTTRKLLSRYRISTPLVSYHAHSGPETVQRLLERLAAGGRVALVSEAGTPGVSDPGLPLVEAALAAGIRVEAVPGPSAVIAALSVAGLPAARFVFEGFLPTRGGERRRRLAELAGERRTIVLYEAPHRLLRTLEDLAGSLGERPVAVARELTKQFEEVYRGTLSTALAHFATGERRGEFTLVVGGAAAAGSPAEPEGGAAGAEQGAGEEAASLAQREGLPLREAARRVATARGLSRNAVYRLALTCRSGEGEKKGTKRENTIKRRAETSPPRRCLPPD